MKPIYKILFATLLLGFTIIEANATVIANSDNFFIRPKSTEQTVLDILANDFYADDGTLSELEITFPGLTLAGSGNYWNSPNGGRVYYDSSIKQVRYRPGSTFVGLDQFTYQIKSTVTNSTAQAIAYVYVNDKPESVFDHITCFVEPDPLQWGIQELARSSTDNDLYVSSVSNILTGDVDGDGKIEIFVYNADPTLASLGDLVGPANKILVFEHSYDEGTDTHSLNLDYEIPLPNTQYMYPFGNFAIASVDDDGCGSLFVIFLGAKNSLGSELPGDEPPMLLKYKYEPGAGSTPENFVKGQFEEKWRKQYTDDNGFKNASPLLVDLMGDGNQQVCIMNKIFDAKTGTLLADGSLSSIPVTLTSDFSFGRFGHNGMPYQSALIAADLDNDGIKELVGGDCIYKVNLTEYDVNNDPTSVNTFELWKRADFSDHPMGSLPDVLPRAKYDGGTALVDFDLDGELDVVVVGKANTTSGFIYVYNPRTSKLMHTNEITDIPLQTSATSPSGPSQPFVGDLDGDGYPEIALTGQRTLRAYKLDGGTLRTMWELPTSDSSSATTLSIFDFAQSGTSQLIYRDETTLRIIDGREVDENNDPISDEDRTLATFDNVNSVTINEYPIVADITGDGSATILATAREAGGRNFRGELRMYGPLTGKWAPAMSVWNQIQFNPLNVNEDLTIPANPMKPSDVLFDINGNDHRPFNNFLQQSTVLNKTGTMIQQGADLAFASNIPKKLMYNNDDIEVSCTIENIGDAAFSGGFHVQLYAYDLDNSEYVFIGSSQEINTNSELAAKGNIAVSFTVTNGKNLLPTNQEGWALTVNITSAPGESPIVYETGKECNDGVNNQTRTLNFLDGMRIICEGNSDVVTANPANTYNIKWYDVNGNPLLADGVYSDTYTLTKNSDDVTYLLVQAYNKTTGTLVNAVKDTVFVYKAPESLVWTGSVNQDWNDYRNWNNPNSTTYPQANIPRRCTNTLLPALPSSGTASYPDLTSIAQSGQTNYAEYNGAHCANITFSFSAELKRPDLLVYDTAKVEANLLAHKWYLFAPPLKNFYTGDFYVNTPIPVNDEVKAYIKLWNTARSNGEYSISSWSHMISNPDIEFQPGQGLRLWISDQDPDHQDDSQDFTFYFPKKDSKYYVYFENSDIPNPHYTTADNMDRTKSGRFIFDGTGANGADIPLSLNAPENGRLVMVANPFMAHIDFDEFYEKNKTLIKSEYRLPNDNNNDYLYYKKGQPGASSLSRYIAPMQSFIVEAIAPFTSLNINGTMTSIVVGTSLRNTPEVTDNIHLPIQVTQEGHTGKTFLLLNNNFNNDYFGMEDIMCLFDTISTDIRPISIYTKSDDHKRVVLNAMNNDKFDGAIIPIGMRTPSTKPLTINVGNLSAIPVGTDIFLYDAQEDKNYNLKINSSYTFSTINLDKYLFLENRFFLRIVNNSTDITTEEVEKENSVRIYSRNGQMNIQSLNQMEHIAIYSIQGQLLYQSEPNAYTSNISLNSMELYVVKIKSGNKTSSFKVINNK